MATINYKGTKLEEITEPQIFDPPQEMLVIDEADDEPIKKRVAAILANGYCHNVNELRYQKQLTAEEAKELKNG